MLQTEQRGLSVCHDGELCRNNQPIEMPFDVWPRVGPKKHVLDRGAHCCNLANRFEPSVCGSDAVLCQIALTICYTVLQVNRYGHLLPARNDSDHDVSHHRFLSSLGPESRAQLCDVVEAVAPPAELQHCLVLVNCLALLASDDGLPLFL